MSDYMLKSKSARLLASVAMLPLAVASMSGAATAQDGADVEEIVVTGIRASLKSSLESRRNSTQLKDEIFAEDIGKFPEANIAEALQRVPGVAIRRDVGEGNVIELRGLGSDFTNVLVHGLAISTPRDNNRSTSMSIFPSALFTRVSIEKSSVASQLEGGVAGTVDMRNARPFDSKEDLTIAAGITAGYNDHSGKISPKGHFIASKTWDASGGRFGLLVGGSYSKRKVRFDGMDGQDSVSSNSKGFRGFHFDINEGNTTGMQSSTWDTIYNDLANTMPDPDNPGEFLDPEGSIPDDRTSGELEQVMFPRLIRTDFMQGTREQYGFVVAAAWEPAENLSINFDYLRSGYNTRDHRYNIDSELRSKYIQPIGTITAGDGNALVSGAWQHLDATDTTTLVNGLNFQDERLYDFDVDNPAAAGGRRSENRRTYNDLQIDQFIAEVNYDISDTFRVKVLAGHNKSQYDEDHLTHLLSAFPSITYFDSVNGIGSEPKVTSSIDLTDPENYAYSYIRNSPEAADETNNSLHVDFTYGDDVNNIKFGIAYDKIKRHSYDWDHRGDPAGDDYVGLWKTGVAPTIADVAAGVPVDNYGHGIALPEGGMDDWLTVDFDKVDALLTNPDDLLYFGKNDPQPHNFPIISEENMAFYVEANGEGEFLGNSVRYNAGFRAVKTHQITDSFTDAGAVIAVDRTYWDYMPSFNIAWDITEDVVIRMAGARTMTRPGFGNLDARTRVGGDFNVTIENAYLQPYFSNGVDMTAEWYFAEESVFAVNVFYKELTGFIENVTFEAPFSQSGINIGDLDGNIFAQLTPDTIVTFESQANSDEERIIKGFEVALQMPFDGVLPWDGFGMVANYTFAAPSEVIYDTSAGPFVSSVLGQSKHLYNLVGYYENEKFAVRASYNYRSDYAQDGCCRANQPRVRVRHGVGQLDTSFSYFINDNFTVALDAINLNNAQEYTTYGEDIYYKRYNVGRQFFLSARANF